MGVGQLRAEVAACTVCTKHLRPRPVTQFGARARILIIGQAPGARVHASGIPWDDDSGDRLREWTDLSREVFYDAQKVALVPMGFCYPGKAAGGDLPPRKECAPLWHARIFECLPRDRLTLLVGAYAQNYYLRPGKNSLTENVRAFLQFGNFFPLPHPAWRSILWAKKNPWFAREVLPALRKAVHAHLK